MAIETILAAWSLRPAGDGFQSAAVLRFEIPLSFAGARYVHLNVHVTRLGETAT
jgi:hypothetical protein